MSASMTLMAFSHWPSKTFGDWKWPVVNRDTFYMHLLCFIVFYRVMYSTSSYQPIYGWPNWKLQNMINWTTRLSRVGREQKYPFRGWDNQVRRLLVGQHTPAIVILSNFSMLGDILDCSILVTCYENGSIQKHFWRQIYLDWLGLSIKIIYWFL